MIAVQYIRSCTAKVTHNTDKAGLIFDGIQQQQRSYGAMNRYESRAVIKPKITGFKDVENRLFNCG